MHKVVLLRHGESTWNRENRFTGWVDVPLSDKGLAEAREAARLLREEGMGFDVAYTSLLRRAVKTLWVALEELDLFWIPVHKHWRLNERHYGGLTGLDKAETAAKYGEEQVLAWRRGYAVEPPPMEPGHPWDMSGDPRYAGLTAEEMPRGESLADTVARFVPYWEEVILPEVLAGRRVLVSAHGNSLRALVKHLSGMGEEEITQQNIPTGIPLVYELDGARGVRSRYLGDAGAAAAAAVAAQGRARE